MFADVGVQLLFLGIMARETRSRQIIGQRDFERPVRIMATDAVGQFIMRLTRMAHAAFRDVVLYFGRMADMAVLTGNRRLMFGARGGNILV